MLGTVACMVVRGSWTLSMWLYAALGPMVVRGSWTLSMSYLTRPVYVVPHRPFASYPTQAAYV